MLRRLIFCICLPVAATPALGQTRDDAAEKSFRVVRTEISPLIDGRLDEEVWALADVVEDFHEIQPIEYDEPSQRTQVFVLYDEDYLYIAAKLWDTEPEGIIAQILRQGSDIRNDDNFGVILDPFHDRRSGYRFQVNPNGVRSEAIYQNTTQTQSNWQGIWQAEARIVEDGWTLEMAIPYKTLSFNPVNDTWGINFTREIARTNETIGWVSRTRAQNPAVAGIAIGLDGLQQGRGLDIVPSYSMRESKHYASGETTTDSEPSLDVFYKFTPALTGVLTLNTDFSATEVDDRQAQSHAIQPVLSGEARLLSAGCGHLRVWPNRRRRRTRRWRTRRRQPKRQAILLSHDWTQRVARAGAPGYRRQIDGTGRRLEPGRSQYPARTVQGCRMPRISSSGERC